MVIITFVTFLDGRTSTVNGVGEGFYSRNIWNSLPNWVVSANTTNTFKNRLDRFWQNQEIIYDFKVAHS